MPYKSAKQRRLMRAVAHNPAFAKKVGIPQSVGRKFEEHGGGFAGGGKVSGLKRVSEWLELIRKDVEAGRKKYVPQREHSYNIENSPDYYNILDKARWDPLISPSDFEIMEGTTFPHTNMDEVPEWLTEMYPRSVNNEMDRLIRKYGIDLPEDTRLYRGLGVGNLVEDALDRDGLGSLDFVDNKGHVLPADFPQSTSFDPHVAAGYALIDSFPLLLSGTTEGKVRALPRVFLSQDEFMLPSEARFKKVPLAPSVNADIDSKIVIPRYAEGGKVGGAKALLSRLLPEERRRLEAILNEEPNLEGVLSPEGAQNIVNTGKTPFKRGVEDSEGNLYEFTHPSPIAMLEPERFRSLAVPDIELESTGRRGEWLAQEIRNSGGLDHIPFLKVNKFAWDDLPFIDGHEGRGRSKALQLLGLKKIPVTLEIARPSRQGTGLADVSDRINWLRQYNKLLPEVDWDGVQRPPIDIGDVKLYAEGGKVNYLPELSQAAAATSYTPFAIGNAKDTQQFAEGVLSQLYGLNERGEPEFLGGDSFSHWPGIVDETLSLGTLLPDRFVPGWAERASERTGKLHEKVREAMGVGPAEGLTENLYNAAGTMATQLPMGGPKAVESVVSKPGVWRSIGRGLSKAGEWFTPTVEAKPSNYLVGTLTGAGLNDDTDTLKMQQGLGYGILGGMKAWETAKRILGNSPPVEDPGVINTYCEGGLARMRTKYASGGEARGPQGALSAIRAAVAAIQAGNHEEARDALAPHSDNPEISKALEELRLAVAQKDPQS